MNQWLSNLTPSETYLVAVPAIMVGAILFVSAIILLLERGNKNDANERGEKNRSGTPEPNVETEKHAGDLEALAAIRAALERPGVEFTDGERPGGEA